ncbi:MAG: class I SAM-dependent methyltransferase [Firmicutes bacterium]|nr:class I SAM-dependent methyltransferase [Bacillota bacterium]
MVTKLVRLMDQHFYRDFGDNWDHRLFREAVLQHLSPRMKMLDLGAGAGVVPELNFKGLAGRVVGLDPDPRVMQNPYLDEAFIGTGMAMPGFRDGQFDLIICCNVLEHLETPLPFFTECLRVLRPGGLFITKTPNRAHYVPLLARLTPAAFHRALNRKRGREEKDTFPTFYRCNTLKTQKAVAGKAGFWVLGIHSYEGRPEYLRFNAVTYLPGILYERLANGLGLNCLKAVLISKFQKPEADDGPG